MAASNSLPYGVGLADKGMVHVSKSKDNFYYQQHNIPNVPNDFDWQNSKYEYVGRDLESLAEKILYLGKYASTINVVTGPGNSWYSWTNGKKTQHDSTTELPPEEFTRLEELVKQKTAEDTRTKYVFIHDRLFPSATIKSSVRHVSLIPKS